MTALLPDIGKALFGVPWQGAMASYLDVKPRNIRAWVAGEEPVPEAVWRDLYDMLRQQAVANAMLSWLIQRQLYPEDTGL